MHHLQPAWRAQSAGSHGQLPADISDAIPPQRGLAPASLPLSLLPFLRRPNAKAVRSCPQTKLYRDPLSLLLHR